MFALLASLLVSSAALADEGPQIDAGVRLGVGAALWPDKDVMPMGTVFAEARIREGRAFLSIAPGLYLPSPSDDLSYGGLAMELGGGWMLSERPVAPYIGGGVAGRLQITDDALVGFAPYAQLGVQADLAGTRAFAELRVYQNLLPIPVGARQDAFPVEPGLAFGVMF